MLPVENNITNWKDEELYKNNNFSDEFIIQNIDKLEPQFVYHYQFKILSNKMKSFLLDRIEELKKIATEKFVQKLHSQWTCFEEGCNNRRSLESVIYCQECYNLKLQKSQNKSLTKG